MKRAITIITILLTMTWTAQAAPVSSTTAAKKAKAFVEARKGATALTPQLALQGRKKVSGKIPTTPPSYYVFNNGGDNGFVIIAGDDRAADILAYADNGTFDPQNIPDNMKACLDGYANEIEWARANIPDANEEEVPQPARQVIYPLIETKWGQDNPFNQLCFTSSGKQSVTGCVATALAQVMYYHRWPKSETTVIPEYADDYDTTIEALPATTFDWEHMRKKYSGNETTDDPYATAVAKLLFYAGHATEMTYYNSSAAAAVESCVKALHEYFGYANKPVTIQRSLYNKDQWENIIYNELHHGRPVIFGANTASNIGHAFVCDGYDGEGLFHINWGWEGLSDGYFRLQALNPASQGTGGGVGNYGFSYKQIALVGISPTIVEDGSEMSDESRRGKVVELVLAEGTDDTYSYSGGSLPSINLEYDFGVSITGNYKFGVALFQGDQVLGKTMYGPYNVTSAWTMTFKSFPTGYFLGSNLADGTYQIKAICQPDGAADWHLCDDADCNFIEVTVGNGTVTFVPKKEYPIIQVMDLKQVFEGGERKTVRVTLKNISQYNFTGFEYLMVNDSIKGAEYACIEAGGEIQLDFLFNYKWLAPINLKVASRTTSNIIYENDAFQFTNPVTNYPEVLAKEIRFLDTTNKKMYGNVVEAAFTLKNNTGEDFHGTISLNLQRAKGDGWWSILSSSANVNVKDGETTTVVIQYIVNYGDELKFSASCAGQTVSPSGSYIVTPGLQEWDGNGTHTAKAFNGTVSADAAAVSFDGLDISGANIQPNSNPNTIYYFAADTTVPASLNGKNVVKGTKAVGNIHLTKGYSYFVPADFDIDGTVDFSFTPQRTCDGNKGWMTITLPFVVQTATLGGNVVDWSRGNVDDEKDLWVKEYQYVQNGKAWFANAASWVAGEPYIIGVKNANGNDLLVLKATNTKVFKLDPNTMVGSGYHFVGSTGSRQVSDAYVLNNNGDAFVKTSLADITPTDAYFIAKGLDNAPDKLPIAGNSLLGDVNGDGMISVSDVTYLVSYILGERQDGFILKNADINGDKLITIADVTALVDIILAN